MIGLESWDKGQQKSRYEFEKAFPEEVCPVCGKTFIRRCRRNEWGWRHTNRNGKVTLLCTGECSKAYAEKAFMRDVRKLTKTKSYQVYKISVSEGISVKKAAERIGLGSYDASMQLLINNHWKELEWLQSHNWEVGECPKQRN